MQTLTDDSAKIDRMRIVTSGDDPQVRMAYLATAGGTHVNGVAELHSQLLKDVTLRDFSDLFPDKFTNVTNGVTPALCAPCQSAYVGSDHRRTGHRYMDL